MQNDPGPPAPGPIDIHIDLSGLANLIWSSFIDHIGEIGMAIWTPLVNTLQDAARACGTVFGTRASTSSPRSLPI